MTNKISKFLIGSLILLFYLTIYYQIIVLYLPVFLWIFLLILNILGLFFLPFLMILGMFYLGYCSKFILKYMNKFLLGIVLLVIFFLIYCDSLNCKTTESPVALECGFAHILSYICHLFYVVGLLWGEKAIKLLKKRKRNKSD